MLKNGKGKIMNKARLISRIKKIDRIHAQFDLEGKKPKMVFVELVSKAEVIKIIKEEWTKTKKQS